MRSLLFAAALFLTVAACDRAGPPTGAAVESAAPLDRDGATQRVAIKATDAGFEPAEVTLTQGVPAVLELTRVSESECVNAVRMPWMNDATPLPLGKTVAIAVDTSKAGTFSYSCWMSMVFGRVRIEAAR